MTARIILAVICMIGVASADDKIKFNPHVEEALKPKKPAIVKTLKEIKIPQFSVEDVTVEDCLKFLKTQTAKLNPGGTSFNILFKCKKETKIKTVTMDMQNVPVLDLFYFVCMQAGLNYRIEEHAIIVWDLKPKEKINRY